MLKKLMTIQPKAWVLAALTLAIGLFSVAAVTYRFIPASALTHAIQPAAAVFVALLAYWFTRGQKDRVRRGRDKAIIVGSVLAIWFVVYFATGIFVTYVHNALVSGIGSVLLNIVGFGLTAVATEYTRHRTLLLAKRRNIIWFGAIVTIVFALPYVNLGHIATANSGEDIIKLLISDITPGLIGSLLSTYLAVACGLPSQMTYRLGIVAMTILPPILPKYDWYLLGVSSILLSIIIYLIVDKTQRHERPARGRHNAKLAFDVMWVGSMVALIMFMTGFFAYKPTAIMSNSMQPVFSRGALVIVKKNVPAVDISIGDIIQYEAHSRVVTHRVINIKQASDGSGEKVFIAKGDNNPSQDQPIKESQLIGVVNAQIPFAGYPTVWLREVTIGNESNEVNG